ncbi:MAG: hypothetical protein BHW15_03530 [Coprococcus sp. CAG:131_42_139]|nr:MAG: hypothetical protein BHW15_03530 [Coprococcus sp. CAG:131_42_139]
MQLSADLVSKFVKATKDTKTQDGTTMYGTVVMQNGTPYVRLDGSEILTPVTSMADVHSLERVMVLVKDHTATIMGNISSPSARSDDVKVLTEVVADKASIGDLKTINADIENLKADNVEISDKLTATEADIKDLEADNVTINEKLTANNASIKELEVDNVSIHEKLTANDATIEELQTRKLDAKLADIKYAQIDFANIGKAALEQFFAKSGLIENVVVGDQQITGTLVGVTILGDSIKGGTVIADKLVIKGEDGLYYKLNTDGNTVEKEQTDYNSLDGGVIRAKSITATKIAVDDLVAFGATIGGWHIVDGGLYSGTKESMSNISRGTYLGSDGQINIGDSDNFIMFYVDNKGESHLVISADKFTLGKQNIENVISDIKQDVNNVRDEITTLLRIESSRGTVFKNNAVSTVLSVVIYHGKDRITDIDRLHEVYGNSAYIQWKWQRLEEETYGIILSTDSRIENGGFSFVLTPDDVDTKVTFMCELITD